MGQKEIIEARRTRRQKRVRKRLGGTAERPRLAVFRSSKHIYAQIIDDIAGTTLASASSLDPDLKKDQAYGGNKVAAALVGKAVAERAKGAGIDKWHHCRHPDNWGRCAAPPCYCWALPRCRPRHRRAA